MVLCFAQARQVGPLNVPVGTDLPKFSDPGDTESKQQIDIISDAGAITLAPNGVYVVSYRLSGTEDGIPIPKTINLGTQLMLNGLPVPGSIASQNVLAGLPAVPVSVSAVSGEVIIKTDGAPTYILTLRNISGTAGAIPPVPVTTITDFSITILRIR